MAEQDDRDALAEVLAARCSKSGDNMSHLLCGELIHRQHYDEADALLDWLAQRDRRVRAEAWDRAVQHVIGTCTYATASAEEWRHVRLVADLYEAKAANPHCDRDDLADRMRASADELTATGYHAATAAELRERADRIKVGDQ